MKTNRTLTKWLTVLAFSMTSLATATAFAQGTALTYQGRLNSGANAANGSYDLTFTLFVTNSGGNSVAGPLTNSATGVTNGLFTVTLDFGGGVFTGNARWLELGVRTNGSGSFTTLVPRQPILPTPYALYASNSATALTASSAATAVNGVVTTGSYADPGWIASLAGSKITGNIGGTAAGFSGNLAGDITGPQGTTVISSGAVNNTKLASDAGSLAKVSGGAMANSGGNVGIGKPNPATALDVNGTVTATAFSGGGTVSWQTVSGTSQQAQPNTGYIVNNFAQVTITLPTSPNAGDIVRVSGVGAGGWKIAQNSGQFIIVGNVAALNVGTTWTPHGPTTNWYAIASSADGTKLVACVGGGQIYTSTDSGLTWTARDSSRQWGSVASSADGSKLVAGVGGGQIYTSTDSGVTWTAQNSGSRAWVGVASSADGSKLVACDYSPGQIYTSTDSGVTWTARDSNRYWEGVASSADGSKLVATVQEGQIYTSTNSGATWTAQNSGNRDWHGVASSADGSKLVALDYGLAAGGQIYTSTNSGVTWTAQNSGSRAWPCVASSADGSKLVTAVYAGGGQIYTSSDSGVTWIAQNSGSQKWTSVASSADGSKLVACVQAGRIYTSTPAFASPGNTTTVGTGGYLVAGQSASIELQYIGNNEFIIVSHEGTIFGY
jgi:hypothetical protein